MPSLRTSHLRHARYYARRCAHAEQQYRDGQQEHGLALFDQERAQIDLAWSRLVSQAHTSDPEILALILAYADATASIGEIRYRLHEERIPRLEAQLAAARQLNHQWAEGQALGNLALALAYAGRYAQAIDYYLQRIELARAIGDRRGEGVALANLGSAYKDQGAYREALLCHQQALEIAQELKDARAEGAQYGNLGNIFQILGYYREAIDFLERHLAIARSVGDRRGEGNALSNLALAYNTVST